VRSIDEIPEPETPLKEQLLAFARELSDLHRLERRRSAELEHAYEELQGTHEATIRTLALMVEAKDPNTRGHMERAQAFGLELARCIDPRITADPEVGFGFLLHDVGKVGIPESILGKPGPLNKGEWEVVRRHPVLGAQLVEPMRFLGEAIEVIRCHHERFDGNGYPVGLKGKEIPVTARIFSVVDSFDAMTSDRPYRRALTLEHALDELRRGRGTQFDPEVVDIFLVLVERMPWSREDERGTQGEGGHRP